MIRWMRLFPYSFVLLAAPRAQLDVHTASTIQPQLKWIIQPSGTTASLRAVSVVNSQTVWASGTGGTFLRTTDGGSTWAVATVPDAGKLDFRGLHAFDAYHAILMSSGTGDLSAIYETHDTGARWRLIEHNPDPKGFFDAIAFTDLHHGFVLGDPVDGNFILLTTTNTGRTWTRLGFPASEGESAFAASNSAIAIRPPDVWVATGGKTGARVVHLVHLNADSTHCCTAVSTPVRHDSESAGIFSLAFADRTHGIAVGGDYAKPNETQSNIAITTDGGATWTTPAGTPPRGYRSSVAWLPRWKLWITTGPTGSEYSRDDGKNWIPFDDGAFNAIAVGPGSACWAVGPRGRVAMLRSAEH